MDETKQPVMPWVRLGSLSQLQEKGWTVLDWPAVSCPRCHTPLMFLEHPSTADFWGCYCDTCDLGLAIDYTDSDEPKPRAFASTRRHVSVGAPREYTPLPAAIQQEGYKGLEETFSFIAQDEIGYCQGRAEELAKRMRKHNQ